MRRAVVLSSSSARYFGVDCGLHDTDVSFSRNTRFRLLLSMDGPVADLTKSVPKALFIALQTRRTIIIRTNENKSA